MAAQPVISSPSANQVFRAGPDFASDRLQDPWDFDNVEDIGPDPDQTNGWAPHQIAAARTHGTGATYLSGGMFRGQGGPWPHDMQMTMLYRGDSNAINTVRTGMDFPIPTARYRKLAFKMRVTGATSISQPVVYWYHTPYLVNDAHLNRAGGVLFDTVHPGNTAFRTFVIDLGAVTATSGDTRLVEACTPGYSGCTGVPAPWLNEPQVVGLRIDPLASGVQLVEIDWVRLTAGDGQPGAAMMTTNYSACTGGGAQLVVRDASGMDTHVGTGSSTSGTFNYGIFPPGNYTLRIGCANGTSSVPFVINAPPRVTVIDPDRMGDISTDYQATIGRPGDPWDFQQPSDIAGLWNISTTAGACQGQTCGLVPSERPGAAPGSLMFRASSVGQPGGHVGDPAIELLRGSTNPISSRRNRILTYSLRMHRPYDVGVGSVARVMWGSGNMLDQGSTTTTQDIRVWPGFQTYTVDLGALTIHNGGIETECLAASPPCQVTPWGTRSIRSLRLDPHEFGDHPTAFDLDDVWLTAPDEVNLSGAGHPKGRFTIRYHVGDADGGSSYTTRILLDTDRNPENGFAASLATGLGTTLGANQYVWTPSPSFPVGSYWVYVETTETRGGLTHVQGAYSTGPLVVFSEQASNLQMSVASPTASATVPFPFSVQGCAFDSGNSNGINVDDLFVFAIANQATGHAPGHTLTLGTGGQQGILRYGPLTGAATQVACPSITNPSSPFRQSGFTVSNVYLNPGTWTLRVMARSTLSNKLTAMGDIPVTVSHLTMPPRNFQASISGTLATISFEPPDSGPPVGGYALDGADDGTFQRTSFTIIVPTAGTYSGHLPNNRTFYLRVRSLAQGGGPGMASATQVVTTGTPPPVVAPPTAPALHVAQGVTNPVTLNWGPGQGGGAPTSYTLYAGTSPGASNLAVAPMGGATTITTAAPVGTTVYVRVVATNAAGSATSNEVSLTVAPPQLPGRPTLAAAHVLGHNVTLSWTPPGNASQTGLTGYTVVARYAGSPHIIATLRTAGTNYTVAAPRGTYIVTVVAHGAAGQSPESNAQTVVIP